jgi:type IV secretion system protein VirB5
MKFQQKAGTPENPYEAARGEWNERYRKFIVAKRNWQILAVVAVASNAFLGWGLLWHASQSQVIPYVVRVDEVGQTLVIGPASEPAFADPKVIAWQLQAFIRDVRSVTADRTAQKAILEAAYDRSGGAATEFLNEHFRVHNPFETMAKSTVAAEIRSLLRISDDSWKVEWKEVRRGSMGVASAKSSGRGSSPWRSLPPPPRRT